MTAEQGDAGRGRLVALVVALVAAAALIGVALLAGGSGSSGSGLRVERTGGGGDDEEAEVTVYVDDTSDNVAATARGAKTVRLECVDAQDRLVIRAEHPWPFTDTDDGLLDPHVHQRMDAADADRVVRCRLPATEPRLEGRLGAAASG